jgi:hypothetical protein
MKEIHYMQGKQILAVVIAMASAQAMVAQASVVETALTEGKVMADFRLRYETNDTDNTLEEAKALTVHSRVGYETAAVAGFKALIEGEMVHALENDYAPETAGYNTVADPTGVETNRAQISYVNAGFAAVAGRQRIIIDNARFVGNVGWRQNEQTYDGIKLDYAQDAYKVQYAYINQVNGITFTEVEVSDHLLNLAYTLTPGTVSAFAYLLKNDDTDAKDNTLGLSFTGKTNNILYSATYAQQKTDDYSATYLALEGGIALTGVKLFLGNETLGSDGGNYGFQTQLATKHAFNGWADKFLSTPKTGLVDTYVKAAGAVYGVGLLAMYHTFEADEGGADLGSELDLQATYALNATSNIGLKTASYSKGDSGADTDKVWIWAETKF